MQPWRKQKEESVCPLPAVLCLQDCRCSAHPHPPGALQNNTSFSVSAVRGHVRISPSRTRGRTFAGKSSWQGSPACTHPTTAGSTTSPPPFLRRKTRPQGPSAQPTLRQGRSRAGSWSRCPQAPGQHWLGVGWGAGGRGGALTSRVRSRTTINARELSGGRKRSAPGSASCCCLLKQKRKVPAEFLLEFPPLVPADNAQRGTRAHFGKLNRQPALGPSSSCYL